MADNKLLEELERLIRSAGLSPTVERAAGKVVNQSSTYRANELGIEIQQSRPGYKHISELQNIISAGRGVNGQDYDDARIQMAHHQSGPSKTYNEFLEAERQIAILNAKNASIAQSHRETFANRLEYDIKGNTSSSTINGQIMRLGSSSGVIGRGYGLSQDMNYLQVERAKQSSLNEIDFYRNEMLKMTSDEHLFDEHGNIRMETMRQIQQKSTNISNITNQLAEFDVAAKFMKAEGLDTQSVHDRIIKLAKKGQGIELRGTVASHIAEGKVGNLDQIEQEEYALAKKLIEARTKLLNATEENVHALGAESKILEERLDYLEEAKRQLASGGGGRGGNRGRYFDRLYGDINDGASIFNAFEQAKANEIQRYTREQQITQGYANYDNYKYQTYVRASQGDQAAMMALQGFAGAEQFGAEQRGREKDRSFYSLMGYGLMAAGGIAAAIYGAPLIAGGAAIGAAGTGLASLAGTMGLGLTAEAATGALATGVYTTSAAGAVLSSMPAIKEFVNNTVYQQSQQQVEIQGRMDYMQTVEALNQISGAQRQNLFDYTGGLKVAGRTMGGDAREAMIRSMTSRVNLIRMGQKGITPEMMAAMQQYGAEHIGNLFDSEQIYTARDLERTGLGTMQQNLARMGTFYAAGASNPRASSELTISTALSHAIENSRVLNAVVQNTAGLTSIGNALGIDTTAAAARMLTAPVTAGGNQTFETNQSMKALGLFANRVTDTTPGLTSGVGLANLSRVLKRSKIDNLYALNLQNLDPMVLETIQTAFAEGNIPEAQRMLTAAHLGPIAQLIDQSPISGVVQAREILNTRQRNDIGNLLYGRAGYLFGTAGTKGLDKEGFLEKLRSGTYSTNQIEDVLKNRKQSLVYKNPLTDPEVNALNTFMGQTAQTEFANFSAREMATLLTGGRGAGGVAGPEFTDMLRKMRMKQGLGQGLEQQDVAAASQKVASMQEAINNLSDSSGNAAAAILNLSDAMKEMVKNMPNAEKLATEKGRELDATRKRLADMQSNPMSYLPSMVLTFPWSFFKLIRDQESVGK